ncbi:MAG: bifunctional NAD(P)/FAD-dependent oxidoreductase/class I SAM-dependent methyltransferase [Actinomycetota bacterium]
MAHDHDHHHPRTFERTTDVAIIGGSAAGLAAGLQLGRVRRDVIVLDAGDPRNAPAAHSHSYLGHEGIPPAELTTIGRAEVRSYGVEVLHQTVTAVDRTDDGRFRVDLASGHAVVARRVLVATGLVDELPDVDGLTEHWGETVIHCPFCHGFEHRDRRLVQLVIHPAGLHMTPLLGGLARDLTVVLHEGVDPTAQELDDLRAAGIAIVDTPARRIVTDVDGALTGIELTDGSTIDADAVVTGVRFRPRAEALASLGLTPVPHPIGLGTHIESEPTGATSVPGVYVAGNVTDPSQQVLQAAANGSFVGAQIAFDLAAEDLTATDTVRAGQREWDDRFAGEPTFSGNPNGTLVNEIGDLDPGRALDVGAGEGADAVWLAEQGWEVTATDISVSAVNQIARLAEGVGAEVRCLHADAGDLDPYGSETYDLVSAQYPAISRSPDDRALHNLLDAVAPGGTLLFVHHDGEAMRAAAEHPPAWDSETYLRPVDVARAIEASPDFDLEIDDRRTRPGGHNTIDVPDLVVRARRKG